MASSLEQGRQGNFSEKEKRQQRLEVLTSALGVLSVVVERQQEVNITDESTRESVQQLKQAGEALAQVLATAPADDPMLWEMVERVYGVDSTSLVAEYFELRNAGVLVRDGLGHKLSQSTPV